MNRQERRRNERRKKTTYNLTPEQLMSLNTEAYNKVSEEFDREWGKRKKELFDEAFSMFVWVPLLAARDHLGFGKKRLHGFAKKMVEVYNAWDRRLITSEDILEALKDETGLDIEMSIDYKNDRTELKLK